MTPNFNSKQILLAESTPGGYVLLEPSVIQTEDSTQPVNLNTYLQGAYVTFFIVIIASAVLSLVYYGINYMISDISSTKADAKNKLKAVFWGLLIAVSSFLLLNSINPDLLNLNLLLNQ